MKTKMEMYYASNKNYVKIVLKIVLEYSIMLLKIYAHIYIIFSIVNGKKTDKWYRTTCMNPTYPPLCEVGL